MERWYALYTKPHKERHVSDILEGKGFETYLPTIQVRRNGRRRMEPFFSCYLFARFDPEEALPGLRWTPGLRRIVGFGDEPAAVPDGVISLLRKRLDGMGEVVYREHRFEPGDRVRIRSGPLRDFEAVFDGRLSSQDRARVLVDFLGRWTPCEVGVDCLERLG